MLLMTAVVSAAFLLLSDRVDAATKIKINKTNFPDATFRAYVSSNFDADKDGYLNSTEIGNVKIINVDESGITKLNGIEYFTALETLYCRDNELTSLDVSKNTSLEKIICYRTQLTTLDVSKNTALIYLDCSRNQLKTLDVSKNTSLVTISALSSNNT